jgi:hypothetical protein
MIASFTRAIQNYCQPSGILVANLTQMRFVSRDYFSTGICVVFRFAQTSPILEVILYRSGDFSGATPP